MKETESCLLLFGVRGRGGSRGRCRFDSRGSQPEPCPEQVVDEHGAAVGGDARAELPHVAFRNLRAEEQDAGGEVNPGEHEHHGPGRAEAGCEAAEKTGSGDNKEVTKQEDR